MSKKFELTSETKTFFGRTLYRIKALISFGNVKTGELGGFIEKEENLDHAGDAWVAENAWVSENARVVGNARVAENAWVAGSAWVAGNAKVAGNARVVGNARVDGNARVYGNAIVGGNADYFCVRGAGSENRNTTFFKCVGGVILVNCGCFSGTLAEFAAKVHETHKGTMYEKEYNAAIELVKIHFGLDDVNDVVKDAAENNED